jgi:hypothetical protein
MAQMETEVLTLSEKPHLFSTSFLRSDKIWIFESDKVLEKRAASSCK